MMQLATRSSGNWGADPDPGTEMELDESLDGPLEEFVPRVRRSV
jgi:hypothetical protein